jgi:cell division protein FtsB
MKRLGLTLLVLTMISATAYYVFTHENIERAARLEREVDKLRRKNAELAAANEEMERTVVALRDDPRLAERRARANSRLARPGEVIFQFGKPEESVEVQVLLKVRPDSLRLAGKTLLIDQLASGLDRLRQDVPNSTLRVRFEKGVDALREQRVRDIVAESPMAPAEFSESDEE